MRHLARTKIIATLGPATDAPGVLDAMVAAGMDCARLNCSHSTAADLRRRAGEVRAASERAGSPLAVLVDLQGPKLRLGGDVEERFLATGDEVVLATVEDAEPGHVPVAFDRFPELVGDASAIVLGDGVPRLVVDRREGRLVHAHVTAPGPIKPRQGVAVTAAAPTLSPLMPKDREDLHTAVDLEAEFIALSFVRSADDVAELRAELDRHGSSARIVAKIEKVEAYGDIDAIVAASDGIMVARGDYGVEAGVSQVLPMQKDVIHRATEAGKLAITATQMLESMVSAAQPTRAEATDVGNAVLDGTSAVMLSGETSVGTYPADAVRHMDEIVRVAEEASEIHWATHRPAAESPEAATMHAAVELAREAGAAALVVPTRNGDSARACAKYRPRRSILALAPDRATVNQLALEWGVQPESMEPVDTVEELIEASMERARASGLRRGEWAVVATGPGSARTGATNLITLRQID